MLSKKFALILSAATFGIGLSGEAQATVANFNFEGASPTGGGALSSLVQTNSGLTITLTRPGSTFDITDLSSVKGPASFGARTLSPFNNTSATPFIVNFSQALTSFSFQAGDYGSDADTISLQLFSGLNATGSNLGSTSIFYPLASTFPNDVDTLTLSSAGIMSAELIGGSANFPNSVYYDNFSATFGAQAVPEPATLTLLCSGLLAIGMVRRRRSTR